VSGSGAGAGAECWLISKESPRNPWDLDVVSCPFRFCFVLSCPFLLLFLSPPVSLFLFRVFVSYRTVPAKVGKDFVRMLNGGARGTDDVVVATSKT
jgi:hypothetical protein